MIRIDWDLDYIKLKLSMKEDIEDCTDTLVYLLEKAEDTNDNVYLKLEDVVNGFVDENYIKDYCEKILKEMI